MSESASHEKRCAFSNFQEEKNDMEKPSHL